MCFVCWCTFSLRAEKRNWVCKVVEVREIKTKINVCIFERKKNGSTKSHIVQHSNEIIEFGNCVWRATPIYWILENCDLFSAKEREKLMRKTKVKLFWKEIKNGMRINDSAVRIWCWHIIRFRWDENKRSLTRTEL